MRSLERSQQKKKAVCKERGNVWKEYSSMDIPNEFWSDLSDKV
jgi:hypothetical protein